MSFFIDDDYDDACVWGLCNLQYDDSCSVLSERDEFAAQGNKSEGATIEEHCRQEEKRENNNSKMKNFGKRRRHVSSRSSDMSFRKNGKSADERRDSV